MGIAEGGLKIAELVLSKPAGHLDLLQFVVLGGLYVALLDQPLVDVLVDKFVLAASLHHAVPLLS